MGTVRETLISNSWEYELDTIHDAPYPGKNKTGIKYNDVIEIYEKIKFFDDVFNNMTILDTVSDTKEMWYWHQ